jgi:hypothetical protein
MRAIMLKYARQEHNVLAWKGGGLSRRWRQDAATLGPGRPSQAEAAAFAPNTELLVRNNEQLSPEQEMVEDLLTIVHCFSRRLYGLGNHRKKWNEALAEDVAR